MSSKSSSPINSTGAMTFYFIFTSIYYMLNYYLINKDKYKNHSDSEAIASKSYRNTMLFGAYVLIIIIGQFFINLNLTAQMCHKAQGYQTLTITVVPWMVIFGVFNLLLSFFPGWLKPFSNTFGYFGYWLVARTSSKPPITRVTCNWRSLLTMYILEKQGFVMTTMA